MPSDDQELNQSVLITGVTGFVGRNLKSYLVCNARFDLVGSSRVESKIKNDEALSSTATYKEVIDGGVSFDSYVHLAGKVYDLKDRSPREEYIRANFNLTRRLFDRFCSDERAKKFIFVSTIHVLTESPGEIIDEGYPPVPVTPYGESKLMAEEYLMENCPHDKQVFILRPGMIHGPGNKGNLNLLYSLVKRGLPYPVGAINNKRSFIFVDNLCFVIKEILKRDIAPGLYHIADDEPTYTHELVTLIAESVGRQAKIWRLPIPLLQLLAMVGSKMNLPLTTSRLRKLTEDFVISNEKIKNALGKPLPIETKEGLRRTLGSLNKEKTKVT